LAKHACKYSMQFTCYNALSLPCHRLGSKLTMRLLVHLFLSGTVNIYIFLGGASFHLQPNYTYEIDSIFGRDDGIEEHYWTPSVRSIQFDSFKDLWAVYIACQNKPSQQSLLGVHTTALVPNSILFVHFFPNHLLVFPDYNWQERHMDCDLQCKRLQDMKNGSKLTQIFSRLKLHFYTFIRVWKTSLQISFF